MTEIPEHLLKRSKDAPCRDRRRGRRRRPTSGARRAGGGRRRPPRRPPPRPAAAGRRRGRRRPSRPRARAARRGRALERRQDPVVGRCRSLAVLPLWAFVYAGTLEPPPTGESDPCAAGAEVYGRLRQLPRRQRRRRRPAAALERRRSRPSRLPRPHDVGASSATRGSAPADTYGATRQATGRPAMPALASALTDAELARRSCATSGRPFGGLDRAERGDLALLEIAEGRMTFAEAGLGEHVDAAGVDESELGESDGPMRRTRRSARQTEP